jgi:hypothetical protein
MPLETVTRPKLPLDLALTLGPLRHGQGDPRGPKMPPQLIRSI